MATRNIIPNANNEGSLGTDQRRWQNGHFQNVFVNGVQLSTVTGKTLYVDAGVGTDTRTGLSKYDITKPFQTIAAAAAASVIGDLVWVRKGSYTIANTIDLDNKGDIYFETATTIIVASNITAFSHNANNRFIRGDANFVMSNGTGKLFQVSGGNLLLELESVLTVSNSYTGNLFEVSAGVLDVGRFNTIYVQAANARCFDLTGSGRLRLRPGCHDVRGGQVLRADTTSSVTWDTWTIQGTFDSTFDLVKLSSLSLRTVNFSHSAPGATSAVRIRIAPTAVPPSALVFRQGARFAGYGNEQPLVSIEGDPRTGIVFIGCIFNTNNTLAPIVSANAANRTVEMLYCAGTHSLFPNVTVRGDYAVNPSLVF